MIQKKRERRKHLKCRYHGYLITVIVLGNKCCLCKQIIMKSSCNNAVLSLYAVTSSAKWIKSCCHSFRGQPCFQVRLLLFHLSHFWFLVTYGHEVTKIWKYYVIFVYILPGKMEKKQKENHASKVTKIPKTKRQKYGMNETIVVRYVK